MIILDCSVFIAMLFDDEADPLAEKVHNTIATRDLQIIVPPIFNLEVVNTLLMAVKRKRITQTQFDSLVQAMEELPIQIDLNAKQQDIIHYAQKYDLTTYDASYVELANRKKIFLASLDKKMVKAAKELNLCFQ